MYDSVARAYSPPFYMVTSNVAIRAFALAANTPDSKVGLHASDFTLYELGVFDDESGQFTEHSPHVNHGLAINFKKELSNAS
ncbi:MAG: nonstructural protein [Microviridae sp.]|nr:MAG: nonstructural protein [Microviridae sp.]